ncbi:MAG: hypothetical protein K6L80_09420 [Agarilytica sp.]
MKMPANLKRTLTSLACALAITGCSEKTPSTHTGEVQSDTTRPATPFAQIDDEKASLVFIQGTEALKATRASAKTLTEAINHFLSAPTDEHLKNAQKHWTSATIEYRRFSFFRHLGLVEPSSFATLNRLDYQIYGYPIQPGFIDTFGQYKYSGLVHDIGFPITEESLVNQHGLTDLADIVLGFYAIEFLLFNSGKERKASDFTQIVSISKTLKERGFETLEEIPNNRRRKLLNEQAKILSSDLKSIEKYWSDPTGGFQKKWQTFNHQKRIDTILSALVSSLTQVMIEIGELNQEAGTNTHVSPGIYSANIDDKKKFIHYAVASIKSGNALLVSDTTQETEALLDQALSLTSGNIQQEDSSEKELWRTVFASIKSASDHLNDI